MNEHTYQVLHLIYVISLIVVMTLFFILRDTCEICFIGFLLINARLNERGEDA
jgi:hypothetical protein